MLDSGVIPCLLDSLRSIANSDFSRSCLRCGLTRGAPPRPEPVKRATRVVLCNFRSSGAKKAAPPDDGTVWAALRVHAAAVGHGHGRCQKAVSWAYSRKLAQKVRKSRIPTASLRPITPKNRPRALRSRPCAGLSRRPVGRRWQRNRTDFTARLSAGSWVLRCRTRGALARPPLLGWTAAFAWNSEFY